MLTGIIKAWLTRSFRPFLFERKQTNTLDYADLDGLGLYVHIPFCRSLCSFCPYCKVRYEKGLAEMYVQALHQEIALVGEGLPAKKTVTSLYSGGGTPALLVDDLKGIIDQLQEYFIISEGIGIELHPEDITVDTLQKLRTAGITMISIGVQSFDQSSLANLGRKGSKEELAAKVELASQAGFTVIDVDLIFAIPGQTAEILISDVDIAFAHGATQVSTYPFIDFTFADNRCKPLPESEKKAMLKALVDHCRGIGKQRTSVWTFANPGTGRYSSVTRESFLGFGVSATTLLWEQFKINTFSVEAYLKRIDSGELPTALILDFTKRQRGAYYLFWSAYLMELDPVRFEKTVGVPLMQMFGLELWLLEKLGLLFQKAGRYFLTDRAAYYYHYLEQAYTTAYIDQMWRILGKEAFPKEIRL